MKHLMSRIASVAMALSMLVLLQATALAQSTMLVDRGLPTSNLNNAAGTNRSNVSWADFETSSPPTEYWLPGDDFSISASGKYKIDTIRVWIVGDVPGGKGKDGKTHLTLWGGTVDKGVDAISHDYSVTPVMYTDGTSYQGSSGAFYPINQVDFKVNVDLTDGQSFAFFIDGPWQPGSGGYENAFLHASNRLLSGSPQQGANDWFLWLHRKAGTTLSIDTWNSGTGAGTLCAPDSPCPGWDKASDGNVQVFGRRVGDND
jgi:hypothetical protein